MLIILAFAILLKNSNLAHTLRVATAASSEAKRSYVLLKSCPHVSK